MAGLLGLVLAFKADANKRIAKFTVLVKSSANTSGQTARFAAIPGGSNAAGIVGVTIEHFLEPNYFVKEGTDPTTVTGTTPVLYNLQGRPVQVQMNGYAKCIAAGAVNQGDELLVADAYGRVNNITNLGISAGTLVYVVGIAQNATANANDIVEVLLSFYAKKT
jgi:hypothetical protein